MDADSQIEYRTSGASVIGPVHREQLHNASLWNSLTLQIIVVGSRTGEECGLGDYYDASERRPSSIIFEGGNDDNSIERITIRRMNNSHRKSNQHSATKASRCCRRLDRVVKGAHKGVQPVRDRVQSKAFVSNPSD